MKKTRILCYLFSIICIVLLFVCTFTGCKKEVVDCSFEFINPETSEYIKPFGKNNYGEIYLTYDGEQKNINFRTVRNDNSKEVNFIENIKISYTYKNTKTGELEYGLSCMQEVGEYYLCINACSYDEEKYYISYSDVSLTIYVQEEGAPKDIELNTTYPITMNSNDTLKFTFTAPYSMQYVISVNNVKLKVFDHISNKELSEEKDNTFFIEKNQKVSIELYSTEVVEGTILLTPSPKLLRIGEAFEYRLGYGGQCVYKFIDECNRNLIISTDNNDVGVTIYNEKGAILYVPNEDAYSYTANEEVYVHIYNTSQKSVEGSMILYEDKLVMPNQIKTMELIGNETVTMLFNCFESGCYEIFSTSHNTVKMEFLDENGNFIDGSNLKKGDITFISMKNQSSETVNFDFIVEFSPFEVVYGTNLVEGGEKFVRFTPVSDEVYLFDGVTKIYDYNFDIVKFENGKAVCDSTNKCYYLEVNNNSVSISIPFETLKLGNRKTVSNDGYGVYYYSILLDFDAEYLFESSARSLSIYNSDFAFIDDLKPNSLINLLSGTYYIKIVNDGINAEICCSLVGNPLNIGSKYVLHNNGYTVFSFSPSNNRNYTFIIENDANNTAKCVLKICKLVDGEMVTIFETQKVSEINESVYLENEDYYVFIYTYDADDQSLIFSSA